MYKTHLLLVFLITSFIALSQNIQDNQNQEFSATQLCQKEVNELDDFLNLSQEQKEQVYDVIYGILIKNNQVKLMKLIEEDKKAILMRNEEYKSLMIIDILVGKQKIAYNNHLDTPIHPKGSVD